MGHDKYIWGIARECVGLVLLVIVYCIPDWAPVASTMHIYIIP